MQTSDLPREASAARASPGKRAGYGAVLRRRPTGRGGPIPHTSAANLSQEVVPKAGRQAANRQLEKNVEAQRKKPQKSIKKMKIATKRERERDVQNVFGTGAPRGDPGRGVWSQQLASCPYLPTPPENSLLGDRSLQAVGRLSPLRSISRSSAQTRPKNIGGGEGQTSRGWRRSGGGPPGQGDEACCQM